ncbi:MAG: hypothetical protein HRT87_06400 [Legionellales bacterium]|nr:hypothetical protein [Legionellales bacterium]
MKNLTKKISYAIYIVLAVVVLSSCTNEESTITNEQSNNRIKLKEDRIVNGYRYSILEVDGKEYLTQDNGGFIELVK